MQRCPPPDVGFVGVYVPSYRELSMRGESERERERERERDSLGAAPDAARAKSFPSKSPVKDRDR